ncbi:hypothetical protein P8605_42230, partial [Streptomyces sp. T-3]|nr:hypothetical protein [Streptomyces sp. T-3]
FQAVVRGGKRRRARRRWAIGAAAALVIAGSTGSLALAEVVGRDTASPPAAEQSVSPEKRHVYEPQRTQLAVGDHEGRVWNVIIDVWGAPKDKVEAAVQRAKMGDYGVQPEGVTDAESAKLIGKSWFFVRAGDPTERDSTEAQGVVADHDGLKGQDIKSYEAYLSPNGPETIVIGQVAPHAKGAAIKWDNGSRTDVPRAPKGWGFSPDHEPMLIPVKGMKTQWLVAIVPEGALPQYKSVEVRY